ncbi:hypothetical protein CEXT_493721 [Caerostris extrusa]|uniref:Uncharacterized protein n=1 Tax=Caerostris extrusa TaxID=172846 RepID=A0AAV4YC78_CAEEX|nr:hypothetical protein CEXT_493721 [Caerostris extrusa]
MAMRTAASLSDVMWKRSTLDAYHRQPARKCVTTFPNCNSPLCILLNRLLLIRISPVYVGQMNTLLDEIAIGFCTSPGLLSRIFWILYRSGENRTPDTTRIILTLPDITKHC